MAHGGASETLGEWCAPSQATTLTPAAETDCGKRVAVGRGARAALTSLLSPGLTTFLEQITRGDSAVPESHVAKLVTTILERALDAFATSNKSPQEFLAHLGTHLAAGFELYFADRRRRSPSFAIDEHAWINDHFDDRLLQRSLGTQFLKRPEWGQLKEAGAALNELIGHGLTVIPAVIATMKGAAIPRLGKEDAESEAAMVLRKVAWAFDPTGGRRLHQLAFTAIKHHLRSRSRTALGGTEDFAKKKRVFGLYAARLHLHLQRSPKTEEVLHHITEWSLEQKEAFRRLLEVESAPRAPDGNADLLPGPSPTPDVIAADIEQRDLVRAALEQLDDSERVVLACRYELGLTKAETARHLGKPPTSTARTEEQALQKLGQILGHDARGHLFH